MRTAIVVVALAYLAVLLTLTFLPLGATTEPGTTDVRLEPFRTIRGALRLGPGSRSFALLIGNIVAFVPVGVLVPALLARRSWIAAVGIGFLLSVAIEVTQFAANVLVDFRYRRADVDDVILNTLGAALGYVAFAVIDSIRTRLDQARG